MHTDAKNPEGPQTRASLARDLAALGVVPGDTLLVHSSLSSLGWVCGGEQAVVQALLDAVGPEGTLVVPTQTMDNSDPGQWRDPAVPREWWPVIRAEAPGFDPRLTPSRHMGRVPEMVRTWPGAVRSAHPQTSFAALGPRARALMDRHPVGCRLGEDSPLAALEGVRARVLLLGAGFDSCTAFHLAEYRVPRPRLEECGCALSTPDGGREWITFTDVLLDERDFERLGADFEDTGAVERGPVGGAAARLFPLPHAVAFATRWMTVNRDG
ncbi:AAC(3) family N-acetyltransferase [Nocardiopsis sp. TSRI0078]|uniref:aminoglycoside N(3)-acetyltransferase n=1 Tax=unclassified Nocardiopsis TaxID=2649073 RepID=UPI0009404490|nr:AAC(3) family N-acetyltransferase [Nocardiopsis sp. TSRI0078]OKI17659.1 AAC(3) family N-acetyltransferase [Nocardiopsis sp. TSRI0078]